VNRGGPASRDRAQAQKEEEAAMHTITLATFKGCQSTVDFHDRIDALIDRREIYAEVELVVVPSPAHAAALGLYGSPTILIDGVEYQAERRGPAGFY
jgi:hypothetical protein